MIQLTLQAAQKTIKITRNRPYGSYTSIFNNVLIRKNENIRTHLLNCFQLDVTLNRYYRSAIKKLIYNYL